MAGQQAYPLAQATYLPLYQAPVQASAFQVPPLQAQDFRLQQSQQTTQTQSQLATPFITPSTQSGSFQPQSQAQPPATGQVQQFQVPTFQPQSQFQPPIFQGQAPTFQPQVQQFQAPTFQPQAQFQAPSQTPLIFSVPQFSTTSAQPYAPAQFQQPALQPLALGQVPATSMTAPQAQVTPLVSQNFPTTVVPIALQPSQPIASKYIPTAPIPKGSVLLGPNFCVECATPLDLDRYRNLINLVRDQKDGGKGLSLQSAVTQLGYDDLKITSDIEQKFTISKPRALSYLLRTPRPCCMTHIQNPSVGVKTQIHTGMDPSGRPLTSLFKEWDTDILKLMFSAAHPLVKQRMEKEKEENKEEGKQEAKEAA